MISLPISGDDITQIVAIDDPVLRNLWITQSYADFASPSDGDRPYRPLVVRVRGVGVGHRRTVDPRTGTAWHRRRRSSVQNTISVTSPRSTNSSSGRGSCGPSGDSTASTSAGRSAVPSTTSASTSPTATRSSSPSSPPCSWRSSNCSTAVSPSPRMRSTRHSIGLRPSRSTMGFASVRVVLARRSARRRTGAGTCDPGRERPRSRPRAEAAAGRHRRLAGRRAEHGWTDPRRGVAAMGAPLRRPAVQSNRRARDRPAGHRRVGSRRRRSC